MTPLDRFALWAALALIPDSRPLTRWKVMRGALVRSRGVALSPAEQKRLLRHLGVFQTAMVWLGIALYAQIRWRPLTVPLFLIAVTYLIWSLSGFVARMV